MLIDYIIITATTATAALVWRALLLDHPNFALRVKRVPIIGGALYCGFCATLWLSLIMTFLWNPLASWHPELPSIVRIFFGWLSLSAGVLFLRNLIAVLMEGNGVLTDMHRQSHNHQKPPEKHE